MKRHHIAVRAVISVTVILLVFGTLSGCTTMKTQWEYLAFYMRLPTSSIYDPESFYSMPELQTKLNELGNEGWDCDLSAAVAFGYIVCKRPR